MPVVLRPPRARPVGERAGAASGVLGLFDAIVLNDQVTTIDSPIVETGPFERFALYLFIDSTNAPTDLEIQVRFLDEINGRWHVLRDAPFTALFYEDTATATGLADVLTGVVAGNQMQVRLIATGTTATATFTITASVRLFGNGAAERGIRNDRS